MWGMASAPPTQLETRKTRFVPGDAFAPGEAWRKSRGSMRVLRYVSLLYTCFFFIEPYLRHSLKHWIWFAVFYAAFLALYFAIPNARGNLQKVLFGLLFLIGFIYFPFNESASGAFVYPVVMLAFVVQKTRTYLIMLFVQSAGIALETWYFGIPMWSGVLGIFFCIVIGFSNLAYSRQQQATYLLQRANEEIEHLAQIAERERIARDLHDLLGHTLTVIAIKSELANRMLPTDPQRAQQEMMDVEQTARKALAEVREAVAGYRSEGLAAEVLRARKALLSTGVALDSSFAGIDLSPAEANVLCLCLREAVTNIVRHASATRCTVELKRSAQGLRLAIHDDGRGISSHEGNGLRGMRERVEGLDGRMSIASAQGAGTDLLVEIPRMQQQLSSAHCALDTTKI